MIPVETISADVRKRQNTSDHTYQTVKVDLLDAEDNSLCSVTGSTWNLMNWCWSKADNKKYFNKPYNNNPWDHTDTHESYYDRKDRQFKKIIAIIEADIDSAFFLLQEVDCLTYLPISDQERYWALRTAFESKLASLGWALIRSEDGNKPLVTLFNTRVLQQTQASAPKTVLTQGKGIGFECEFTHVTTQKTVTLTNVHLDYSADYTQTLPAYQREQTAANKFTIIGGDMNHAPGQKIVGLITNGQHATNLGSTPDGTVTDYDQGVLKQLDGVLVNPGQQTQVRVTVTKGEVFQRDGAEFSVVEFNPNRSVTSKPGQPYVEDRGSYFQALRLDWSKMSNKAQATAILDRALELAPRKVGITYSANHGQTEVLYEYYKNPTPKNWKDVQSTLVGANQATVMQALIKLLDSDPKYAALKTTFQILPISTMPAGSGNTKDEWLAENLNNIRAFAESGGTVLGWQNQEHETRFAVGGGVAGDRFSKAQSDYVQQYLQALSQASQASQPVPPVNLIGKPIDPPATHAAPPPPTQIADAPLVSSPALSNLGLFNRKSAHATFMKTLNGSPVENFLNWLENFYCNQYLASQGKTGQKKKGEIEAVIQVIKADQSSYQSIRECLDATAQPNPLTLEKLIKSHRRWLQPQQTWGWKIIQASFLQDAESRPDPQVF